MADESNCSDGGNVIPIILWAWCFTIVLARFNHIYVLFLSFTSSFCYIYHFWKENFRLFRPASKFYQSTALYSDFLETVNIYEHLSLDPGCLWYD